MQVKKRVRTIVTVIAVVALAYGLVRWHPWASDPITLTADFADTTGLYVGNQVDYLGVPIGHVVHITPEGPVMRVELHIDPSSRIPRNAGAQIMQSALLTDRYIELGPAYTGGPTLASGANIPASHTRSPINIDDLARAVDELVNALDAPMPGGTKVGGLVHALALQLGSNGARLHDLLTSGTRALTTINADSPDIIAVTDNLAQITKILDARNATLHSFGVGLSQATTALASQGSSLASTIGAFNQLTAQVRSFIHDSGGTLAADLAQAASVAHTIHDEQADLARIWDLMPTGAENVVRAYDPKLGALRVEMDLRHTFAFSSIMAYATCTSMFGPAACNVLVNPQGTGPLNQLITALTSAFPGTF